MLCHCEPVRRLVWQSPKSREPLAYTHIIGGFLFHLVNCQGTIIYSLIHFPVIAFLRLYTLQSHIFCAKMRKNARK